MQSKPTAELKERLLDTKTMFSNKDSYMNPVKIIKLYGPK